MFQHWGPGSGPPSRKVHTIRAWWLALRGFVDIAMNSGTRPTALPGSSGLATITPPRRRQGVVLELCSAASPAPLPGTGNATLIVPAVNRPTAARSVCRSETVPASWTSGHSSPVWPQPRHHKLRQLRWRPK